MSQFATAIADRLPAGYAIQRQLGAGGTSWVYLAEAHAGDAPALVVKVLHPGGGRGGRVARFRREMDILRTLDHPRIVPILETGEADGMLFFTMPFVEGDTLRHRLQAEGRLPVRDALQVARDVVEALGHAHGRGVVHRDVKPENILLTADGARLMDFGYALAPALHAGDHDADLVVGTPAYMSPEQITGGPRAADWRSDFFSLGCVLQEMLTGQPPYGGASSRETMQRRLDTPPDDVRALRPDVPDVVVGLLRRCLARTPNDRWATASFLRIALDGAIAEADAAANGAAHGVPADTATDTATDAPAGA